MKRRLLAGTALLARRRARLPAYPVNLTDIDYASFKLLAFGPQRRAAPSENHSRGI
jgi:hypothetical protein